MPRCLYSSALALTLIAPVAVAQWNEVRPMKLARQETGAALIGDVVYVCGGLIGGPPNVNTASVEAYHVSLNVWVDVAPMPLALDHAAVMALNGKLHVIGGVTRSGGIGTARDEMHVYNPATNTWSAGTPLPQPRSAPWASTINGKIHLVGGTGPPGGARPELYEYDPVAGAWTERAPMSAAREHLNAVTDGAYLYVIGGRVGGTSTTLNERYDPGADLWTTLTPMPTARAAMAMAVVGGEIHCMGGETPMLFNNHEIYDIGANTWSSTTPMPAPRHGIAAVTLPGGGILVPAGGTVQGLQPSNHTDIFGPLPLTVPTTSPVAAILLVGLLLIPAAILVRRRA